MVTPYSVAEIYQKIRRQYQPYYRVFNDYGDLVFEKYFKQVCDIIKKYEFDAERYIRVQFKEYYIPSPKDLCTKRAIDNYRAYAQDTATTEEILEVVNFYIERLSKAWGLSREDAAAVVKKIL